MVKTQPLEWKYCKSSEADVVAEYKNYKFEIKATLFSWRLIVVSPKPKSFRDYAVGLDYREAYEFFGLTGRKIVRKENKERKEFILSLEKEKKNKEEAEFREAFKELYDA